MPAEWIAWALFGYAGVGLIFAIYFAGWGVNDVDQAARNAGFLFRLLIVPGCVAIWPVLLKRCFDREGSP